jgi:small subunit ribosomal protein S17e
MSFFAYFTMGRIRTNIVRRQAEDLYQKDKDVYTDKFEENKKVLAEKAEFPTKKLRNLIAGYITKKVKTQKAQAS